MLTRFLSSFLNIHGKILGNYFGGVNKVRKPFEVLPGIITTSPVLQLQCPLGYEFALFLITQFIPKNLVVLTGGTVMVDMTATFEVTIGGGENVGYATSLEYKQSQVPAYLKIDYSFAGLMKRGLAGDECTSLSSSPLMVAGGVEEAKALSGRWVTPSKRRVLMTQMGDDELYESIVALLGGEHAPRVDDGVEYVAWLEKALRALYPEYQ